jgi:hypothetical protein
VIKYEITFLEKTINFRRFLQDITVSGLLSLFIFASLAGAEPKSERNYRKFHQPN